MSSTRPPISIYLSYARKDEHLASELQKHLSPLRRGGNVFVILDTAISPGSDWYTEIDNNLNKADIIILLISADFLASDYFYSVEMRRALERHERGEAQVIPVILRPVNWQGTPFSHLQVLPKDGIPITQWADREEAFANVVRGISQMVKEVSKGYLAPPLVRETTPEQVIASLPRNVQSAARSSKTATLRRALQEYHSKHPSERLVIHDHDDFVYYDNIMQVTYIWQIWQTLSEFGAVRETLVASA
jgi:hypothetical protein